MTARQADNTSCDLWEGQEGGGNDRDAENNHMRHIERGGKKGDFQSTRGLLFGDAAIKRRGNTGSTKKENTLRLYLCNSEIVSYKSILLMPDPIKIISFIISVDDKKEFQ